MAIRHPRTRLGNILRRHRGCQRCIQTQQTDYGERIVGYLGTLSYFYRNPELQMGEYCRMFGEEADAQAWTAPYKGKAVMVHVNPCDPSRSVLRKEEL